MTNERDNKTILIGDEPEKCIDAMVQSILKSRDKLDFRDLGGELKHKALKYELEKKYCGNLAYNFEPYVLNSSRIRGKFSDIAIENYLKSFPDTSDITYRDFFAWYNDEALPFLAKAHGQSDIPESLKEDAEKVLTGFRAFNLIFIANGIEKITLHLYMEPYQSVFDHFFGLQDYKELKKDSTDKDFKPVFEKIDEMIEERPGGLPFTHDEFSDVMGYFAKQGYTKAVIKGAQKAEQLYASRG